LTSVTLSGELDVNTYRGLAVAKVHHRHELETLVASFVSAAIEQHVQEVRVPTVTELGSVECQVYVDTSNVFSRRITNKKIRHPPTNHHDGVTEPGEDLSNIHEHAPSRVNLTGAVVSLVPWFGGHDNVAAQAGFSRRSRMASAASSPRPPA
jgi:hypothetical protein